MQAVNLSAVGNAPRRQTFANLDDPVWRIFNAIPDMVNGAPATFGFIFVSAGLHAKYHWLSDATFAGWDTTDTEDHVKSRLVSEATVHSILLAAGGMDAAKARSHAIAISAARIGVRRAWGITDADLVATQMLQMLGVAAAGGGARAVLTIDGAGALSADWDGHVTVRQFAAERAAVVAAMTAITNDFLPKCMQSGVGMPPCNGVTLVRTLVHHYVDPHKSICDAYFRQIFGMEYAFPAGLSEDDMKDLICHKAAHPVDSPRLVGIARDRATKEKLVACGQGAAAVRVPAEFDPERAAASYKALVNRARAAAAESNVAIDADPAADLVVDITAHMNANPTNAGLIDAEAMVNAFKEEHGYDVSWCAGYLDGLFDFISANPRTKSIIAGYGVSGLQETHGEGWANGKEHFELAQKWRKARAKEGHLAGIGLFGMEKPDDWANPELMADSSN